MQIVVTTVLLSCCRAIVDNVGDQAMRSTLSSETLISYSLFDSFRDPESSLDIKRQLKTHFLWRNIDDKMY